MSRDPVVKAASRVPLVADGKLTPEPDWAGAGANASDDRASSSGSAIRRIVRSPLSGRGVRRLCGLTGRLRTRRGASLAPEGVAALVGGWMLSPAAYRRR